MSLLSVESMLANHAEYTSYDYLLQQCFVMYVAVFVMLRAVNTITYCSLLHATDHSVCMHALISLCWRCAHLCCVLQKSGRNLLMKMTSWLKTTTTLTSPSKQIQLSPPPSIPPPLWESTQSHPLSLPSLPLIQWWWGRSGVGGGGLRPWNWAGVWGLHSGDGGAPHDAGWARRRAGSAVGPQAQVMLTYWWLRIL